MKVKELIELLSKLDQEREIVMYDHDYEYDEIGDVIEYNEYYKLI
jgi:hypothetical protein